MRQAAEATRMSSDDRAVQENSLRQVTIYLSNEQWTKDIPELGTNVHRIVKRVTGNNDPYRELKDKYNQMALKLYPRLRTIVQNSKDPTLTAAKVAIAGNSIDFGPKADINLEQELADLLDSKLAMNDVDRLKESILNSGKVLYLADNAGETVFDRILIEEFSKRNVDVTYAVKDAPILNDATFQDAEMAGIVGIARVASIGTDCTGILFDECSEEFLRVFRNSSLVISKGQGNYESLTDVENKEIFFLLKAKCPIIAENIGVAMNSTILMRAFKNECE
jgi:uncharacterized protein with ATP-grasp and redox domains